MGLRVALTTHENNNLVIQDNIEVCEMLTAPASPVFSYSLSFLGSKKPLSRYLCENSAGPSIGLYIMGNYSRFSLEVASSYSTSLLYTAYRMGISE